MWTSGGREHEGILAFLSQVRTWPMSTVWWAMLGLEVVEAQAWSPQKDSRDEHVIQRGHLLTAPSTTSDSKQLTSQAPERSAPRQSEGNLDLLRTLPQPPTSHLQGAQVLLKGNSSPASGTLLFCQPEP